MWEHLQRQLIFKFFTLSFLLKVQLCRLDSLNRTLSLRSEQVLKSDLHLRDHRQHEVTGMMFPH